MNNEDPKTRWRAFTEEMEVTGHQLIDQITKLIAEGNVRKLRIISRSGDVNLEIPLTAGTLAGGVVVLTAPWLALLGALAGVLAHVRIEIVRSEEPPATNETKPDGKP